MEAEKPGRMTPEQKEILIEYMETHPMMRKGKVISSYTASMKKRDWMELRAKLNAEGGPQREINQWQRSWRDIKIELKKKYRHNMKERLKTGGGKPKIKPLSEMDERVKVLMGPDLLNGLESSESMSPPRSQDQEISMPSTSFDPSIDSSQATLMDTDTTLQSTLMDPVPDASVHPPPFNVSYLSENGLDMDDNDQAAAPTTTPKVNSNRPLRRTRVRGMAIGKACCDKLVVGTQESASALQNISLALHQKNKMLERYHQKKLEIKQQQADALSAVAKVLASFASSSVVVAGEV